MSSNSPNNARGLKGALYQPVKMTAIDWLVDCVIAAGAFGFGAIQLTLSANLFIPDHFTRLLLGIREITPGFFEMMAVLATCLPLIARRRFPWPVFIASLALWTVFDIGFGLTSLSLVASLVALFTLAYERRNSEALAAGAIMLVAILLSQISPVSNRLATLLLFQNAILAVAVTLAGVALHARQDRLAALEERAIEAERTRESEAQRRVEEERVRIAREIHDITAHSLSAINIQASVAERMVGNDNAIAKEAIGQVRSISKEALGDMRSMVGVLRGSPDGEKAPVQGTDRLEDLVKYLGDFGIVCKIEKVGYDRKSIPSHVDVAIFGIAREGCTNIARHSGAKNAVIRIQVNDGPAGGMSCIVKHYPEVVLLVSDDGAGFKWNEVEGGRHGLEGMRERALALGGSMDVVPSAMGGAQIQVVIPFDYV